MSNWVLYFGVGGIGFGGEIPSAFIDALDVELTKVPNAQDGSTHTATSPVSIGGAGIVAPGAFYASGATLVIPAYAAWQATHAYTGGVSYVTNGGNLYYCLISGTSAGSGGPSGTATTPITDGGVTWSWVSPAPSSGYGLTVASGAKAQINGGTLDVQAGGVVNVNPLAFLLVQSGGNLEVLSGGTATIANGGLLAVAGTGELQIQNLGLLQLAGGSSMVALSGAQVQINSGASALVQGTLTAEGGTGTINIGDTASGGTGVLNINKDSSLTVNGVSGHPAQVFIGQFGIFDIQSGGFLQVFSGGELHAFSGSTMQLDGAVNQTGVYTKSGTTGYTVERETTFNNTATIASPAAFDIIRCTATGGPSITLTLGAPPAAIVRTKVVCPSTPNAQADCALTVTDQVSGHQLGGTMQGSGGVSGKVFTTWPGFVEIESFNDGGTWHWIAIAGAQGS